MRQGVIGGKMRSCEVEIAGGDEQLHVGILGKGVPEVVAGIGIAVLRFPVPLADSATQREIFQFGIETELAADIIVEGGGVGGADGGDGRIKPTIRPPFTSTFNDYVRRELGFNSELEYFTLGGGIGQWDWESKNSYADTSDNLRNTFAKNPHMKLFVASGYFDLATPHFATDYTLAHLGLTTPLR